MQIRREGLAYLKKYIGELPQGDIRVSSLYPPEKSWTKSPGWWLELPLKKLNRGEQVHLLCENKNGKNFHFLRVPVKDIEEYIKKGDLEIRSKKEEEVISLILSARPDDLFLDLRGGRINFAKYLVELPNKD